LTLQSLHPPVQNVETDLPDTAADMAFDRVEVRSIEFSIEIGEFDRVRAWIVRVRSSSNSFLDSSIEFEDEAVRFRSSSKMR